jgi:hypothetical protein
MSNVYIPGLDFIHRTARGKREEKERLRKLREATFGPPCTIKNGVVHVLSPQEANARERQSAKTKPKTNKNRKRQRSLDNGEDDDESFVPPRPDKRRKTANSKKARFSLGWFIFFAIRVLSRVLRGAQVCS